MILYSFFLPFFFFYFFLLWFYDFPLYYTYILFFLFCVNLLWVLNLWLPCFTSMSISPITICLRKKKKERKKEGREGGRKNSCPLSWWCYPIISSSVTPFSSCPQSFSASGAFSENQLFRSGGQILELQHQSFLWIFRVDFL